MKFVSVPIIKSDKDLDLARRRLNTMMRPTNKVLRKDPDEIRATSILIEDWERAKFPVKSFSDPVSAIRFRMNQLGLTSRDLIPIVGSQASVSRLLNGQRITLEIIRKLRRKLDIPADALILPLRRIKSRAAEGL